MNQNFRKHHEMFYNRYSYIAIAMASKVNRLDVLGLEREDIKQELRLKLWTAIPEYIKKWKEYRNGGIKPVPMRFYLSNVLNNKIKDFYKFIDREKNNIHMSKVDFDCSDNKEYSITTFFNLDEGELVVEGVDLMRGLNEVERKAFAQYIKGHKLDNIEKIYGKQAKKIRETVSEQVKFIKNYHSDLIESKEDISVMNYSNED